MKILHTRLRTGCSSLNYDLFVKSISDTPLCSCRSGDVENVEHFFLSCNFYRDHRIELFRIVIQYCIASLHVFLHGDESLPCETNQVIFEAVYKYIHGSKIFCPLRPLVSSNKNKTELVFHEVSIYLPTK